MKVALCFIISYHHILHKEEIWKKWIYENNDIINVYFHYTDENKIKSKWIKKHIIPKKYISSTDYFHIVSSYFSLMKYATIHDNKNQWFCFLTESCCPIISPFEFKQLFYLYYNFSLLKYNKIHWNPYYINRANLKFINKEYHYCNNPWFTLCKKDVQYCLSYFKNNYNTYKLICNGNVSNESIFAIILYSNNRLHHTINKETVATDWSRMESPTSPYTFRDDSLQENINFIEKQKREKYIMFIRKISIDFSDDILIKYIWREKKKNNYCIYYILFGFLLFFTNYYCLKWITNLITIYIYYIN